MDNQVKRNILLNPGPATTTDTVKLAQVVPDICPRERDFGCLLREMGTEIADIAHAGQDDFATVFFCGSGTVNIDAAVSSLLPAGKKILVVNNGAYSARAAHVCGYYGLPHIELVFGQTELPDIGAIEKALREDADIAVVYVCHHETGTGLLNPIREIGAVAHRHGCTVVADTTSSFAMIPIGMERDNLDFIMSSAQKGLMAMTGLSFIIGRKRILDASKEYPKHSYYCNLYRQYAFFEQHGEMQFTPPVQAVYAARQAILEYRSETEQGKWDRHQRVWRAIVDGIRALGMRMLLPEEKQSRLCVSVLFPDDPNWDFDRIHDYCYARGFTIYPGKAIDIPTFRLCSLGAIDVPDIEDFFEVFRAALADCNVKL